jgi:hydroxyacylglutathione hydrolase
MAASSDPQRLFVENAGALTGRGNNTWLLDGAVPTLVDAGPGRPDHLAAIARLLGDRPLARVIVTHGHRDHAGGVPALRSVWPSIDACKCALPGESGWHALREGDRVPAGDRELLVLHTPGHAADHICLWDEPRRHLYAGDMVLAGTTVAISAEGGGSLRAYLSSLARLAALEPVRIFPGHGEVIDRPVEAIAAYLEHRRERERQVLACVAHGVTRAGDIAAQVYRDLPAELRPAATAMVAATLEKLREDGHKIEP